MLLPSLFGIRSGNDLIMLFLFIILLCVITSRLCCSVNLYFYSHVVVSLFALIIRYYCFLFSWGYFQFCFIKKTFKNCFSFYAIFNSYCFNSYTVYFYTFCSCTLHLYTFHAYTFYSLNFRSCTFFIRKLFFRKLFIHMLSCICIHCLCVLFIRVFLFRIVFICTLHLSSLNQAFIF